MTTAEVLEVRHALQPEVAKRLGVIRHRGLERYVEEMARQVYEGSAKHPDENIRANRPGKYQIHICSKGLAFSSFKDGVAHILIGIDLINSSTQPELAAIIGHELGHPTYRAMRAKQLPCDYGEEVFADYFGTMAAGYAGYNARSLSDFFAKVRKAKADFEEQNPLVKAQRMLDELFDVHPVEIVRESLIDEDFIAHDRKKYGEAPWAEERPVYGHPHTIMTACKDIIDKRKSSAPAKQAAPELLADAVAAKIEKINDLNQVLLLLEESLRPILDADGVKGLAVLDMSLQRAIFRHVTEKQVAVSECEAIDRIFNCLVEYGIECDIRGSKEINNFFVTIGTLAYDPKEEFNSEFRVGYVREYGEAISNPAADVGRLSVLTSKLVGINRMQRIPPSLRCEFTVAPIGLDEIFSENDDIFALITDSLENGFNFTNRSLIFKSLETQTLQNIEARHVEHGLYDDEVHKAILAELRFRALNTLEISDADLAFPDVVGVSYHAVQDELKSRYYAFWQKFIETNSPEAVKEKLIALAKFEPRNLPDISDGSYRREIEFESDGEHPAVAFIRNHRQLFSDLECLTALNGIGYTPASFREFIDLPNSHTELIEFLAEYKALSEAHAVLFDNRAKAYSPHRKSFERFVEDSIEALYVDENASAEQNVLYLAFASRQIQREKDREPNPILTKLKADYRTILADFDPSETCPVTALEQALIFGNAYELFDGPEDRRKIAQSLLINLERSFDPSTDTTGWFGLVSHTFSSRSGVRDIEFLDELKALFVDKFVSEAGPDRCDRKRNKSLIETLEPFLKDAWPDLRVDICNELAKGMESQYELTMMLRDLARGNMDEVLQATPLVKTLERLFVASYSYPQARSDLIGYLTTPRSRASAEEFAKRVIEWQPSADAKRLELPDEIMALLGGPRSLHAELKEMGTASHMYDMHQNFWALSTFQRMVLMKQIIQPPGKTHDLQAAYEDTMEEVLDKLFGEGVDRNQDPRRWWAREFMRCFVRAVHESERGYVLAGLLAASEDMGHATDTLRDGEKLALVFRQLGPAYFKLAQAINSYSKTPEDIRNDLKGFKSLEGEPLRWEYFEIMEKLRGKDYLLRTHIGQLIGAASFNIVIDADNDVFVYMRPHAAAIARKGFDELEDTGKKLADAYSEFQQYENDFFTIINNARESARIESDPRLQRKLHDLSCGMYNGFHVVPYPGYDFRFVVPQWKWSQGEGRIMQKAKGVKFYDLPTETDEDRTFKAATAKAILTMELKNLLEGKHYDSDRHEDQYLIDVENRTIHVFDPGGINIAEPSSGELYELGDFVQTLIQKGKFGADSRALSEAVSEYHFESRHLNNVRKGLLALSFIFEALKPEDFVDSLKVAAGGSKVHPQIVYGLTHEPKNLRLVPLHNARRSILSFLGSRRDRRLYHSN